MEDSPLLILLIALPITAWLASRRIVPAHRWLVTGIFFGSVVGPVSNALYSTYFASPLGLITGLVGLVSVLMRGSVGDELAVFFGVVPSRVVISSFEHTLDIELLAVGVWAVVYGFLGWFVGSKRTQRIRSSSHVASDLPAP
mgnify:CR=1 FL=1